MSLGRLLIATRDHLRAELALSEDECQVMPGPEPPPACGQKFISIYGSNWSASSDDVYQDQGIYESYDIVCAITFRSSYVPFDKLGEALYVKRLVGIEDFCRKVMVKVHNSQEINTLVDTMLEEDHPHQESGYGIQISGHHKMVEYLRWASTDPNPLPVTGSWFNSDETSASGLVMECRFNQATRFSTLGMGVVTNNFV